AVADAAGGSIFVSAAKALTVNGNVFAKAAAGSAATPGQIILVAAGPVNTGTYLVESDFFGNNTVVKGNLVGPSTPNAVYIDQSGIPVGTITVKPGKDAQGNYTGLSNYSPAGYDYINSGAN